MVSENIDRNWRTRIGVAKSGFVKRRDLIVAGLGAVGTPVWVEAQPVGKIHRIGWLDFSSAAENLGIFVQAMRAHGWLEGKTFRIEYRGGEGKVERLAEAAAGLVRLPVDVILAPGTAEVLAAAKATASIPIVMAAVDDPVERGLVASLARPGRNITGLSNVRRELCAKLLSLLREFLPRATAVAMLWDATDAEHELTLGYFQSAAKVLGLTLNSVQVQRHTEVEQAIATIKKRGDQLLIVSFSGMLVPRWIVDLALKHGLPVASTSPAYAYEGGLMAFSDDWNAVFDRTASFVDRILKGAKPADLPVELPTKFKLIVNAKTAQSLRLKIPPSIRIRADHIIE